MEHDAKELEKEKIRTRYKGVSPELLEEIPGEEYVDILKDEREKRVGVYVRVSTDDPRQTSSFELQRNHYTDLIDRYPNWKLYRIYADEGISGTSLKHRKQFLRMIEDCKQHKLDLIVTKSVSRFARNIYHCIGYIRMLASLTPPVGVLFETEGLYTLRDNSEMALTFTASFAQEESRTKSSSMNLSYEMRFRRGIFMLPKLLGYDKDEEGNLVINDDEAQTVRLIFFMFLYGNTPQEIADALTKLQRQTKKGNTVWTTSSIIGILQNERHCGDVLAHKTWTPSYLDHKAVKNDGKKPQYRQRDHHEAIISRDDFFAAQQLLAHSMTGRTGMLPHLHVIDNGPLSGFIVINPRWTGFGVDDYFKAASSVAGGNSDEPIVLEKGALDLRGFSVVRGQFFESPNKCSVKLSHEKLHFYSYCLQCMNNCKYVEFLFDPIRKLLVVRSSHKGERNAIDWNYYDGKKYHSRYIIGRAYLPVFYEIMNWPVDREHLIQGECRGNGNESILVFDLKDAEAVIRQYAEKEDPETDKEESPPEEIARFIAMPAAWASSFGSDYYQQDPIPVSDQGWDIQERGRALPRNDPFKATEPQELKRQITSIVSDIKEGVSNGQ